MSKELEKVVQKPAEIEGAKNAQIDVWKWTKNKRKAVKLILKGWPDVKIAAELGVHRNTIRNWKRVEEFHAAVITEAREYVNRRRFQRVFETGVITDNLSALTAKKLSKFVEDGELAQVDLNALQLLLREYREFRTVERGDFGDDVRRVEGGFNINIQGLGGTPAGQKSTQSFKRFIAENADVVARKIIESVEDPQQALVDATRELMKSTTILDDIHDEEKGSEEV